MKTAQRKIDCPLTPALSPTGGEGVRLKSPFPWFGGKSRCAHLVWERFGNVPNYVEPFFGSGAVLLGRPHPARVETINDLDCFVANFWRAVKFNPEAVAEFADSPINEADLHARHRWLVSREEWRARMMDGKNPEYFDAKIAGWWVWGQSMWIGSGWCVKPEWTGRAHAGRHQRGIEAITQRPALGSENGIHVKRPILKGGSVGVHCNFPLTPSLSPSGGEGETHQKRPNMKRGGLGVHSQRISLKGNKGVHGQLPQLGGDGSGSGRGVHSQNVNAQLLEYFAGLAARLRRVRVCCGDWQRILGPSPTFKIGVTGVFLDPPYSSGTGRDTNIYAEDSGDVAHAVREWALANGDNPELRIALCGYEGEHPMPDDWECVPWKANGGYANARMKPPSPRPSTPPSPRPSPPTGEGGEALGGHRNNGQVNAGRERIWFSPHCLAAREPDLMSWAVAERLKAKG